ncbi:hypothetical protein OAK23_02615 [Flavobacteriaceae bacterium]|nr:hypothetical protein [Flavobacteriaceae bacterium]|tara:strand:- start:401 stop:532 length:132 start_codon:yes stop_codon:yes gene_type:complete
MDKKRRRELREEYEKIQGERYVKQIQKEPSVSWSEWVDIMKSK